VASFVANMGAATPQIAYTASKGAVLAMTREIAVIYARQGIRANALCPGPIMTPLLAKFLSDDARRQRRLVHIPMGRFGEPRDASGALPRIRRVGLDDRQSLIIDGGITPPYVPPIDAAAFLQPDFGTWGACFKRTTPGGDRRCCASPMARCDARAGGGLGEGALDQDIEDALLLRVVRGGVLGVPLDRDERGVVVLERLDHAVGRGAHRVQVLPEAVDGLVVRAGAVDHGGAEDPRQAGVGRQRDLVERADGAGGRLREAGRGVGQQVGAARDVLEQGPAEGDVDDLQPSADGDGRHPQLDRGVHQRDLEPVLDLRAG
jgi:hypothetical protein